jgi:hypothetical protein
MRFILLLERLVHPFRFSLDSLVVIAAPSSVVVAVIVSVVERLCIPITFSPALGSVDSLSLLGNVALGARFGLEPRLVFGSVQPIAGSSFSVIRFSVSSEVFEAAGRAISNGGFAFSGLSLIVSEIAAHASMEALSAIMTKALARLDCAPSFGFSFTITTAETVGVASFTETVPISIAIPTSKVAESAWCLRLLESLVINGFVPSSRGKGHSRRRKDNFIGVYKRREFVSKPPWSYEGVSSRELTRGVSWCMALVGCSPVDLVKERSIIWSRAIGGGLVLSSCLFRRWSGAKC